MIERHGFKKQSASRIFPLTRFNEVTLMRFAGKALASLEWRASKAYQGYESQNLAKMLKSERLLNIGVSSVPLRCAEVHVAAHILSPMPIP
jgi:hypothetical protein